MAPTFQPARLAERWIAHSVSDERSQPLEGLSSFFARFLPTETVKNPSLRDIGIQSRAESSGHNMSTLSAIIIAGVLGGAMVIGFCESLSLFVSQRLYSLCPLQ